MLKVLHVINTLRRGGSERQLITIVEHSKNIDHHIVTLHLPQQNYLTNTSYPLEKITVITEHGILRRLKSLNNLLNCFKPNIVYTWGTAPTILSLLSKINHDFILVNGSIRYGVRKCNLDGLLRMILANIISINVANSFAGLSVNFLHNGYILYNGINDKFDRNMFIKSISLNNIALNTTRHTLISVANLMPYKDYKTVFNALHVLSADNFDFIYYVVGDGPLRADFMDHCKAIGINDKVIFLGNIPNPEAYLAISDIFIHSSYGEGCSNAILEAMYMGLPIIASNRGGIPEIVESGSGILFEYGNVENLASIIKTVAGNKELQKSMGEKSYQIVENKYTIQAMVQRYEDLIDTIYNKMLK